MNLPHPVIPLATENALASRKLIRANPEYFERIGAYLDLEFSHERCWWQAVGRANGARYEASALDHQGNKIKRFTKAAIRSEWERWKQAWKTKRAQPFKMDPLWPDSPDRSKAYAMPRSDSPDFVLLLSRGCQVMIPTLVREIDKRQSTAPADDECAQLVLAYWAIYDLEAYRHRPVLTNFQLWRNQSRADSPESKILGRDSEEGPFGYDFTTDSTASYLANRDSTSIQHTLHHALTVLLDSPEVTPGVAESIKTGEGKSPAKRKARKKERVRPLLEMSEAERIKVFEEWQASDYSQRDFARFKGIPYELLASGRKAKARGEKRDEATKPG